MDDFERLIAKLRVRLNDSADDLYERIVAEMRERVVMLCVLRDKLQGGDEGDPSVSSRPA